MAPRCGGGWQAVACPSTRILNSKVFTYEEVLVLEFYILITNPSYGGLVSSGSRFMRSLVAARRIQYGEGINRYVLS